MNNIIKNTTLAYAAGYIDGDGCFSIRKEPYKNKITSKYPAAIVISSVNPEVLYWFKDIFGGSVQKNNTHIPNHKYIYYFHLKKTKSINFSKQIMSYLVEKVSEAKTFIDFINSTTTEDKNINIDKMYILKNSTNLVCKSNKIEFESERNTIEPTEEDFAYLAGFIDAECCLGIQRYRSKDKPNFLYKIQLQCNNTKAPVFKWLLQRFGGQVHFIDRRSKDINQRDQLTWRLTSASLANILEKIHPFLIHKKPVCEELMKFNKTILKNGGARHTEEFRKSYADSIKQREEIVNKVHLLNLKGINS
ncbi:MAG TPA: LAGLIDADG family homing endonuclease [Bacteroidia bacterium]|jgi:hypothetical protein|nr:LAGLIDADG family homing endonuclease [Bacteroidia bacterium]